MTEQTYAPTPARTAVPLAIDPAHTGVSFTVRHLMVTNVTGRFKAVRGTVHLDRDEPARSLVEAEIDAASLDTGAADRDAHLRSPDFFDVENHPKLSFRSRRVERTGERTARVVGDLTIRGVTREVPLDVEYLGAAKDPWGGTRHGFEATGAVDRRDFGLTWNAALEAGGVLVGDRVKIVLDVQATEPAEK